MNYEVMSVAYILFAHVQHICQDLGRASEENRQVVRAVLASHGCFRALARCCQGRGTKDVTWWTFCADLGRKWPGYAKVKLYKLMSFDTVHMKRTHFTCGVCQTCWMEILHKHSCILKSWKVLEQQIGKKKGLRVVDAWCGRWVCILVSSS